MNNSGEVKNSRFLSLKSENNNVQMNIESQLPESLVEEKEYCLNCGRVLGEGSRGVRVMIESIATDKDNLNVESETSYFCEKCARSGVCIKVKGAEDTEI